MSEETTVNVSPQRSVGELQIWREELVQRMLRFAVWFAVMISILAFMFYLTSGNFMLVPVSLILWVPVLIGGYARIPYSYKVWLLLGIPILIGGLMSIMDGWAGESRTAFLISVGLAVVFFDAKTAYRLMAVFSVSLVFIIVLLTTGVFTPILSNYVPNLVSMGAGLVVFVVSNISMIYGINYIFPRMLELLGRTEALSQNLEVEQRNLSQRARELELSYEDLQQRSDFLESTVEVTQVFATAVELDLLLERSASVMSRAFGYYQIGIFTVDEEGQWADLRAASSQEGRRLIAGGHRLRTGNHSMVGWVLAHHQDRVANAVADDPYYYSNPNLPETASALTMPLMNADQIIGVLDIQSRELNTFQETDVRLLRGVADQLALAMRNALRLSEEAATMEVASPFYRVARNLATSRTDEETLDQILTQLQEYNASQAAIYVAPSEDDPGELAAVLHYDEITMTNSDVVFERDAMAPVVAMGLDLESPMWLTDVTDLFGKMDMTLAEMLTALAKQMGAESMLIAPIRIEDRMAGMAIAFYDAMHVFSPFERQLIRLLTGLGGVAMERSRLLVDARTRLERERLLGDVAARMRTTLDMDLVLQGALQEIGDRLNIPDIEVRMGSAHQVDNVPQTESANGTD